MITDERAAFNQLPGASVFSTVTRHRGEEENEQVEKARRADQQWQQHHGERMSRRANQPASSGENARNGARQRNPHQPYLKGDGRSDLRLSLRLASDHQFQQGEQDFPPKPHNKNVPHLKRRWTATRQKATVRHHEATQ